MERKTEPTKFEKQAKQRINELISEYCGGSQQELANRTNVAKASISQYANGKNVPSNITAMKLCTPFGINPAWLMGFDVPKRVKQADTDKGFVLSSKEKSLIEKYRLCDQHGRELIEYMATAESARCQRETNLIPIAAHHEAENNFTDEQNQKIAEFIDLAMKDNK